MTELAVSNHPQVFFNSTFQTSSSLLISRSCSIVFTVQELSQGILSASCCQGIALYKLRIVDYHKDDKSMNESCEEIPSPQDFRSGRHWIPSLIQDLLIAVLYEGL